MGIADDIKKLGEDIIASYDMRVKWVGELVSDTHEMLKGIQADNKTLFDSVHKLLTGFQAEHKEMAANLRAGLAKGETERLKEFKSWWSGIQKEVADLLNAFKTEREKMAANWQAIVETMAKKRGIKPKVEAEVRVRPVEEAIKEVV